MRPANIIEITTPNGFVLNGLWFGPLKPKRAIILLHGLTGSAFSRLSIVDELIDDATAVVTFNNRGASIISKLVQKVGTETKYTNGGTAHEVFTDCIDDIEGALRFVRKVGVKDMYLAGHSTGCQKIVYWASKRGKGIEGLILLAPLSDYAGERKKPQLRKAIAHAKRMIKAGKGEELLPKEVWPQYFDAERFLSLYTSDSIEEIFSYAQPDKKPKIYSGITLPVLALFAEEDEYSERPSGKIIEWFKKHSHSKHFTAEIIPKVGHSFKEGELVVARHVRKFVGR